MITRDYYELFRYLMELYCLRPEDMEFVPNIAEWCSERGLPETDEEKPLRLVPADSGCGLLIREDLPEWVVEERINALRVRGQIRNVAFDRADMLNSERKKLAYLFLSEYAASLPGMEDDDLAADDWAYGEMEKLGFFKE